MLTVVSFLVVVAFVCAKQEMVQSESESADAESDEIAAMSARRSSVQRILLSYVSVLSSVGDMKARGPAFLRQVTGWAATASGGMSVGVYYVKCALGWSFFARLWGGICLPLLLVLLCALYVFVRGVCKGSQRSSAPFLVGCFVMVVFLAYSAQTKDLLLSMYPPSIFLDVLLCLTCIFTCLFYFAVFDCYGPVSDISLLHSDMAVKCYQGSHLGAMAVSGVWLVVWAIILPVSVFWVGRWQTDLHEDHRFSFLFGELSCAKHVECV